jgi:hypothetical protein
VVPLVPFGFVLPLDPVDPGCGESLGLVGEAAPDAGFDVSVVLPVGVDFPVPLVSVSPALPGVPLLPMVPLLPVDPLEPGLPPAAPPPALDPPPAACARATPGRAKPATIVPILAIFSIVRNISTFPSTRDDGSICSTGQRANLVSILEELSITARLLGERSEVDLRGPRRRSLHHDAHVGERCVGLVAAVGGDRVGGDDEIVAAHIGVIGGEQYAIVGGDPCEHQRARPKMTQQKL